MQYLMSTITVQQFKQDLATWLGAARQGEPVLITEHGHVIAQLSPPDTGAAHAMPTGKSMAEWLDQQEQRMQRLFGNRTVADSAAMLDLQRSDRE